MSNASCDKCKSDRLLGLTSKSSDCNSYSYRGAEVDGYLPYIDHVCGGDYLTIQICLECGKVQGKFPVHSRDLEEKCAIDTYYFHVGLDLNYSEDTVAVVIVSQSYWDLYHHVDDHHLTNKLEHRLPRGIDEVSESHFESQWNIQTTIQKMLAAGFVQNEEFSNWSQHHDPFV